MTQTLKFGSLYVNDKPIDPGTEYKPDQAISFGTMTPDKAINWVPVNGLLIADRCLLARISWDDLNDQGLVFGREIQLFGFRFWARLLKVGNCEGVPNEWDSALDVVMILLFNQMLTDWSEKPPLPQICGTAQWLWTDRGYLVLPPPNFSGEGGMQTNGANIKTR